MDAVAADDLPLNPESSPAATRYTAMQLAEQLARRDGPRPARTDLAQTAALAAWTVRGSGLRVLVGKLEEGLRDDEQRAQRVTLRLPERWCGRH